MEGFSIDTQQSVDDFITALDNKEIEIVTQIGNEIEAKMNNQEIKLIVDDNFINKIPCKIDDVINGKDKTKEITNIAYKDGLVYLFKEKNYITRPFKQWVLSPTKINNTFEKLNGKSYYNYRKFYDVEKFEEIKNKLWQGDFYFNTNPVESFMIDSGVTCFKSTNMKDVSILSFDLETTGFNPYAADGKILCIGSTYRHKEYIEKKIFREDQYDSQKEMIEAWALWVTEKDPSILTGYNIYLFDIPYMLGIAEKHNFTINIGRDGSSLHLENRKKPREFRKDGSQSYDYKRPLCWGRDIVDMWMVTIKFDVVAKKHDSYALKQVIKVEGMEKEGRTFYDASKIKEDWSNPEKREDICNYCVDDSEDPIKLADKMLVPTFILTSYIPKPLQLMVESNTGGQVNSLLVRSYLQDGWAIPKGDKTAEFQGAISFGVPGLYKNVVKFDVSSLYPSVMRQYKIKPRTDYLGNFLKMLDFFTIERLKNKKIAEETGDKFYDALQNVAKIFINSAYGFLTTAGLNFNDLQAGASVTRYGREVLEKAIMWATGKKASDYMTKEEEEHENE